MGDCARFEGLPEAINQGQFLIPRMNAYELRQVIEGPILHAGGLISPVLLHQLLGELGDDQDQLPVLQHCLMRMWQVWSPEKETGRAIDQRHYEMTGGLQYALNNHADEIWKKLEYAYKEEVAARIFKSITELKDGRGYRRPVQLEKLIGITGASKQVVMDVLEVFRGSDAAFILPDIRSELQEDTVVDIPHESLMRLWERLRRWSYEEENAAELYRRLAGSALRFEQGQSALWRDPELQLALDWREDNKPNKAWGDLYGYEFDKTLSFLDASRIERERLQKEKKRRSLLFNVSLLGFLLVLSMLTIWAFQQRNIAQISASEALKEKRNAQEKQTLALQESERAQQNARIASEQKAIAEKQSQEALLQKGLALENARNAELQRNNALAAFQRANYLQEKEKAARKQAEEAREAAERNRNEALDQKKKAEEAARKIDRLRNQAIAQNLAAKSLQMQKNADPQLKGLLALKALKFIRDNGGDESSSEIVNALYSAVKALEGRQAFTVQAHSDDVKSVRFIPALHAMVSAGNDGRVVLYRADNGSIQQQWTHPQNKAIISLHALSDGRLFALPETGPMWEFQLQADQKINITSHLLPNGRNLGFSSIQKKILIWQQDKVCVWDPEKKSMTKIILKVGGALPEITRLLGQNHALVKVNQQERICQVLGEEDPVLTEITYPIPVSGITSCLITPKFWVATYQDGNMQAGGYSINAHRSSITKAILHNNHQLITCGLDGTVKIWNTLDFKQQPVVFAEHDSWVWDIDAWDKQLISGSRDRQLIRYELETEVLEKRLKKKVNRGMSEQEWKFYVGNDIPWDQSW